jgi:GDPmannose 4,6-dehydratase
LNIHHGDVADCSYLDHLLREVVPSEIYHLASQSHVGESFRLPEYTGNITGLGTIRLLEAFRKSGIDARFYQASSSELFGNAPPPQNESTPLHPCSPYGIAKLYAYWAARHYRETYGLFVSNGILFNHESPRRGDFFVTRKITKAAANIKRGLQKQLFLGNLDAKRDWGYAPEYVESMWLMLQHDEPDDFVIGTGESHSVRDFVREAFNYADLDYKKYIRLSQDNLRPQDVNHLQADYSKAKKILGWEPVVKFKGIVSQMMHVELNVK